MRSSTMSPFWRGASPCCSSASSSFARPADRRVVRQGRPDPLPRVTPREPALCQGGGETFDVLDCQIQGRDVDAELGDRLPEIDAYASQIRAAEGQVVMTTDAEADADRGDPAPRAFDP